MVNRLVTWPKGTNERTTVNNVIVSVEHNLELLADSVRALSSMKEELCNLAILAYGAKEGDDIIEIKKRVSKVGELEKVKGFRVLDVSNMAASDLMMGVIAPGTTTLWLEDNEGAVIASADFLSRDPVDIVRGLRNLADKIESIKE